MAVCVCTQLKETSRNQGCVVLTWEMVICPARHQAGPTEDELLLRGEANALWAATAADGRRRRRREDDGQKWEERLQENWENCVVSRVRKLCGKWGGKIDIHVV